MPEPLPQYLLPSVSDQYRERFGARGEFDRSLFPEPATLSLMAEALRRDMVVSDEDLEAMHQTLYRQPMPAPGVASHPSGHTPPVPVPPPEDDPIFFAEMRSPSPVPPEEPERREETERQDDEPEPQERDHGRTGRR